MTISELLAVLFPHLTCLQIDGVCRSGRSVRIWARTVSTQAACSRCGPVSQRGRSSYERRVCDSAVGGQETVLHLRVRRFRCGNDDCAATTFAEQVPGLTVRYGRYSVPLRTLLQAIDGRSRPLACVDLGPAGPRAHSVGDR
ncbi:transposase family protein [Microbispora hainanensis]|uniref:transposase family protein n=1 Tax=Microbispora hainanensis TaxID=568844 RepID=UPI00142EFA31|nr:transposase family protein [Microbispora hainanensis]